MAISGWIGVDLDGTLAEYHGWNGGNIGPPIPKMLARVKAWRENGVDVRIMTARASSSCSDTAEQIDLIDAWCLEHVGEKLPITCMKDFAMVELWDDRAVQVIPNTGERADGIRT